MKPDDAHRILVTGSRGKSSVARALHAACSHAGLRSYARITGIVPREIGPGGIRSIQRPAGANIGEMRWWLQSLPARAECIILENSAISPEYQGLAGHWLRPDITVLTNAVPDHQEAWGPDRACAADALVRGVPRGGRVVLPSALAADGYLCGRLEKRACRIHLAEPAPGIEEPHRAVNLGLALVGAEGLGLARDMALQAMLALEPDAYDFRVVDCGGAELAMAFSANDPASTRSLYQSLGWMKEETRLLFNHRADRPGRYRGFLDWLDDPRWREVLIIGDRPWRRPRRARFLRVGSRESLEERLRSGGRVFGCGNMAGLPMTLVTHPEGSLA